MGRDAFGKQPAVPAAPIADVALHALTEKDLMAWSAGLPPVTMKTATRRRLTSDFRAALNAAAAEYRSKLPATLAATIRHGLKASAADAGDDEPIARDNQNLSDAEVARLIGAARDVGGEDGDVYRLVLVMAATGARFSQVARLRVSDCQLAQGRLMIPASRKGKGKSGSIPVPVGRDVLDALVPAVVGRAPDAPLLERRRYRRGPGIEWSAARAARGRTAI